MKLCQAPVLDWGILTGAEPVFQIWKRNFELGTG
jgi:hypothetical protein